MGGWEKCARPAERAVAVLQSHSNVFWSSRRFVNRFGKETLEELADAGVVQDASSWAVVLEKPYRVRDQWQLEYARKHSEDGLRRELERLRSIRRRYAGR